MLGHQLCRYKAMHSTTVNQSNCSCRELRTIQTTHPIPLRRHTGLPKCNWIGLRPFSTLRTPLLHLHWQTQQTRRRGNGGNTTSEHGWRGNFKIQTFVNYYPAQQLLSVPKYGMIGALQVTLGKPVCTSSTPFQKSAGGDSHLQGPWIACLLPILSHR